MQHLSTMAASAKRALSTTRSSGNSVRPSRKRSTIVCTCTHFSARDMLLATGPDLEADPLNSNLILPEAIERQASEGFGDQIPSCQETEEWWGGYMRKIGKSSRADAWVTQTGDGHLIARDATYISVWTLGSDYRKLDFIIACTGRKPIFVFTNHPSTALSPSFLEARMRPLAERMRSVIPERRVFAIVGIEPVTQHLAAAWQALTGHVIKSPAYYEATHTFCTRKTLAPMAAPSRRCRMGLATKAHTVQAGLLCSAFTESAHDDPYRLSVDQGIQEAAYLISRKELYVCEAPVPESDEYAVVCIIAVTRKSRTVAAVSKVFTHDKYRCQGYAKELLTYVCHDVLRTKEKVVLFVAHDLKTAARVYGRVGFVGVGDRPLRERALVERWLELGFDDVDIGHW